MDFIRRNSLLVTPGSEGLMITVLASSLRDLGLSPGPWPCLCVMCMGDILFSQRFQQELAAGQNFLLVQLFFSRLLLKVKECNKLNKGKEK